MALRGDSTQFSGSDEPKSFTGHQAGRSGDSITIDIDKPIIRDEVIVPEESNHTSPLTTIATATLDGNEFEKKLSISEKAIEADRNLVSRVMNTDVILKHWRDKAYSGINDISSEKYRYCREILRDGNSGWRAIGFSYFDALIRLGNRSVLAEEITRIHSLNNLLTKVGGFKIQLFEDMVNETLSLLRRLKTLIEEPAVAREFLFKKFNDLDSSNMVVYHLRLLASSWLRGKAAKYQHFQKGGLSLNGYCTEWLETPNKELDALGLQLLIDVLCEAVNIQVHVDDPNHGQGSRSIIHGIETIDSKCLPILPKRPAIHLLRREYCYDILYTQDPEICINDYKMRSATMQVNRVTMPTNHKFQETPTSASDISPVKFSSLLPIPGFSLPPCPQSGHPGEGPTFLKTPIHGAWSKDIGAYLLPNIGLGLGHNALIGTRMRMNQVDDNPVTSRPQSPTFTTTGLIFGLRSSAGPLMVCTSVIGPSQELTSTARLLANSTGTISSGIVSEDHRGEIEESQSETLHPDDVSSHLQPVPKHKVQSGLNQSTGGVAISQSIATRKSTSPSVTESESYILEEDTDWEEDTPGSFEVLESLSVGSEYLPNDYINQRSLIKLLIERSKQDLVDSIMQEFWEVFGRFSAKGARTCTTNESSEPTSGSGWTSSTQHSTQTSRVSGQKHYRDNGNDQLSEDEDGTRNKRNRNSLLREEIKGEFPKFGCPYRKHNPQKYCAYNGRHWRSCALTPLDTVARVKGHIYRHHRVFQCRRCKELFQKQENLNEHAEALTACELQMRGPVEGVTNEIEKRLRCRKKTHPNQSEEDRWREIYQILFPGESVPSPYFEPPSKDATGLPHDGDLIDFAEYNRLELPQIFRAALENVIRSKTQPLEEQLRSDLMTTIQTCQDQVISNYRRMRASEQSPRESKEAKADSPVDPRPAYWLNKSTDTVLQEQQGTPIGTMDENNFVQTHPGSTLQSVSKVVEQDELYDFGSVNMDPTLDIWSSTRYAEGQTTYSGIKPDRIPENPTLSLNTAPSNISESNVASQDMVGGATDNTFGVIEKEKTIQWVETENCLAQVDWEGFLHLEYDSK